MNKVAELCLEVESRGQSVRVGLVAAVASAAAHLFFNDASRGRGGEQVVFVEFGYGLVDLRVVTRHEVVCRLLVVLLVLARVARHLVAIKINLCMLEGLRSRLFLKVVQDTEVRGLKSECLVVSVDGVLEVAQLIQAGGFRVGSIHQRRVDLQSVLIVSDR